MAKEFDQYAEVSAEVQYILTFMYENTKRTLEPTIKQPLRMLQTNLFALDVSLYDAGHETELNLWAHAFPMLKKTLI